MSVPVRIALGFAMSLLAGCHRAPPPPEPAALLAPTPRAMAADLSRLVERYWEGYEALNPSKASASGDRRFDARLEDSVSLEYLARSLALERQALADLGPIRPELLDPQSRLTYEVFRTGRENAIEGFVYPQELLPVEPFDSMPQRMARLAAGEGVLSFIDARAYEDWPGRIDGYVAWTQQAILNLRDGMRRGYLIPSVLVERLLPQLQELARDRSDNPLLRPLQLFPPGIDAATRARLTPAVENAVRTRLMPAYRALHDFLRQEYLPQARPGIGMSALPMGDRWYDYRLRMTLGKAASVARAQSQALAEVQRLKAKLGELAAQAGFADNLPGFFALIRQDGRFRFSSPSEMIEAFSQASPALAATARNAHSAGPAVPLRILPLADGLLPEGETARFAMMGAPAPGAALLVDASAWQRTLRGDVPGLVLRESDPGRYLQYLVQVSRTTLPRFRRFGRVDAFERAWADYALSLGEELGAFADADSRVSAVLMELREALLAVADVGIHARGWSRQQAIGYLREHLPIDEPGAALAVDRCIAEPGSVLASSLGAARIRALRMRAQGKLGAQFDARAFHARILSEGAMPLDVLDESLDAWIRSQSH